MIKQECATFSQNTIDRYSTLWSSAISFTIAKPIPVPLLALDLSAL